MEYISSNATEMKGVAKKVAPQLHAGEVLLLYGDLGSGKSTFAQGLAEFFGVKEVPTSPTFNLINIYDTPNKDVKKFVHVDTYRIKDESEMKDIGIDEYLCDEKTLCVIEWPEKIENLLKNKNTRKVTIEHLDGERRKITLEEKK